MSCQNAALRMDRIVLKGHVACSDDLCLHVIQAESAASDSRTDSDKIIDRSGSLFEMAFMYCIWCVMQITITIIIK